MPARYEFGHTATVKTKAGVPGSKNIPSRPDDVLLAIRSGRNSIELVLPVSIAEDIAAALREVTALRRDPAFHPCP